MAAEFFGPNTLDSITARWLDEWRTYINRTRSNKTVNRYVSFLKAMRSDAIEYGRLSSLPMWPKQLIEESLPPRYLSGRGAKPHARLLDSRLRSGQNQTEWCRTFFMFRLNHGSRFGESRTSRARHQLAGGNYHLLENQEQGAAHLPDDPIRCASMLSRRCKTAEPTQRLHDELHTIREDEGDTGRAGIGRPRRWPHRSSHDGDQGHCCRRDAQPA